MTIRQRARVNTGPGADTENRVTDSSRPLWQRIVAIGASVPDEEWAKVPADLSKNLDHYLYGAPKEEDE